LKPGLTSALWSGLYFVLLVSMVSPFNFLTISFVMIPLVIMYVRLTPLRFALHLGIVLALAFFALGSFGSAVLAITLFFLMPAILMGHLYKRGSAARTVVTAGVVTMLGELLLGLIIAAAFGMNAMQALGDLVRASLADFQKLAPGSLSTGMIDDIITLMTQMIPLYLIVFSLYYVVITHALSRLLLKAQGFAVPAMKPMKEWMLPKSTVWYYLIALTLDFFVKKETGSTVTMILLNSIPLLMLLFSVQALAFFFFLADRRGWGKALPFVMIVPIVLFPPLSLLGVLDVAFPIRKGMTKS